MNRLDCFFGLSGAAAAAAEVSLDDVADDEPVLVLVTATVTVEDSAAAAAAAAAGSVKVNPGGATFGGVVSVRSGPSLSDMRGLLELVDG